MISFENKTKHLIQIQLKKDQQINTTHSFKFYKKEQDV